MKDYFNLAWNENEPYILLDYDKRLNNSINIKSLINRISKGISSFHTILEFEDDSSLHPQVLQLNYKKPIVQTHTSIVRLVLSRSRQKLTGYDLGEV